MSWNIQTPGDYINGPLTVAGTLSVTGAGPHFIAGQLASTGSTAGFQMQPRDGSGANWLIYNPTGDDFKLYNNVGGDVLTVSNVGNVAIGIGTPNVNANRSTLTLQGSWGGQVDINVGLTNHAQFGTDNFSSGASCRIQSQDSICFKTSGATIGAFLNTNGAFSLQNAISNANGTGIVFPSTQNSSTNANTLDDYEEGTWTPVVTAGTGTLTSVTGQSGAYTKVGRMVIATCFFTVATNGTGGSFISVAGLPFANGNLTNIGIGRIDATNGNLFQGKLNNGASAINIWRYDNTYPAADGAQFPMTITYYV